ncbi:MAG: hypothetical protein AAGA59_19280 [Actinomycetota bacterium]
MMLRVGACGPPEAGKATTIETLATELTHATLLDVPGSRAHIRWLEYLGGRHRSRPIHTQLLAVTDDATTSSSDHVLRTSDAVLFVADTTKAGIDASAAMLERVRASLAAGDEGSATIVVQANKRDADDALPIDQVRDRLGLGPDAPLVETVATQGSGLRHVFVVAVRAGLARHGDGDRSTTFEATPEELVTALTTPTPPTKPKKPAGKKAAPKKRAAKKKSAPESAPEGVDGASPNTATTEGSAADGRKPRTSRPPHPDEVLAADSGVATLVDPPTVPATWVPPTEPAADVDPSAASAGTDQRPAPNRRSTDKPSDDRSTEESNETETEAVTAIAAPTAPSATEPGADHGNDAEAPAPPPPGPDSVRFDAPPPAEDTEATSGTADTGQRGKGAGRRGRR